MTRDTEIKVVNGGALDNLTGLASEEDVVARLWVSFATLKGSELSEADKMEGRRPSKMMADWTPECDSIRPDMKAISGSRKWNIQSAVNVNERNREVELHVVEVV